MQSGSSVRFLMIGVGGMAQAHIEHLLQIPEAEIVGLVDPDATAIDRAKARFPQIQHVPEFANYEEALLEARADAAVIVTPHSQHYAQGMACLEAGLHVLMEKPFVAGSENARRIIQFAEQKGRHLAVSYQRHTQGEYLYLRELVQSGALGDITFISAYQAQAWLEGCRGTWRQDLALSCGGQLNDSGSHLLDVILWISGLEPKEVRAVIDNRGTEVDIDTALTVRFQGGALCTFNVVGASSIDWWEDVSIHGTAGTALYRNGRLSVSRGLHAPLVEVTKDELLPSGNPDRDFVDLLLGRVTEPAAPAECGYRVARLTEAAWQSAQTGGAVRF